MKTSKRSLIASIAVLCVCALSLSTATFAWFSAVNFATVTDIELTVAKASDLQIAHDDFKWDYSVDSILKGEAGKVRDVSTDNASNFAEPANRADIGMDGQFKEGATASYTTATSGWVSETVYLRSPKPADNVTKKITFSGELFTDSKSNGANEIASGMRVAVIDNMDTNASAKFFGNTANNASPVISGKTLTAGTVNLLSITSGAEIITLKDEMPSGMDADEYDDEYVYGKVTLIYYVEGTDANVYNNNSGANFNHKVTFTLDEGNI